MVGTAFSLTSGLADVHFVAASVEPLLSGVRKIALLVGWFLSRSDLTWDSNAGPEVKSVANSVSQSSMMNELPTYLD